MAVKKGNKELSGKVSYNSSIVKGIVVLAVSEVEGVSISENNGDKAVKGNIKLEFNNQNVKVNVTVAVRYGYNIPEVAYNIQQSIKQNVENMSDYKIESVDVNIVGVTFDDDNVKSEY